MIQGTLKTTGVAVGTISINLKGVTAKIEAEFYLVNPETGSTIAGGSLAHWSPETVEAIRALRSLMERDIGRLIFDQVHSTDSTVGSSATSSQEPTGIGEFLQRSVVPPY